MSSLPRASRVGIYAGTFDPVHAGHIAFALQAIEKAELDEVVFLPERRPRYKPSAEHFGHRVAMLNRAVRPHARLSVLELVDSTFSVKRTLPQLQKLFPGSRLVMLIGSDLTESLPVWPDAPKLLRQIELVVGVRHGESGKQIARSLKQWSSQPIDAHIFTSHAPHVSSGRVRELLRKRRDGDGMLTSVKRYARQNWLYVSLSEIA